MVLEPSEHPRFLGQSSGISFAKMVMSALRVDHLPVTPSTGFCSVQEKPSPAEASLPPSHVAHHLAEVYFQYRTPHLPTLSRSQAKAALDDAYKPIDGTRPLPRSRVINFFTAYMVFAIALVSVPHAATPGDRPVQSEGCYRAALGWVEELITHSKSEIDTLRTVLLLAQYVAISPRRGNLWHLTGFAIRLSIDAGLHWETEAGCFNLPAEILDDRRRLWYSTYYLDRLMCITLGRPFGIADESTNVQFPSPWMWSQDSVEPKSADFDRHSQRAHNHLFALAQHESEIRHVQHSQSCRLKIAYPRPETAAWLRDFRPRLQEWYDTIPDTKKAHPSSIFRSQAFWDVAYYNTVQLLYRPRMQTSTHRSEEALITFEASCKIIDGLKTLQREGRVEMLWKSVYQLFMAGLGVIYALWQWEDVRDQTPAGQCISTLQACASTLSAMAETLTGAAGCRDAFETLSTITINWLISANLDQNRQTRLDFESHLRNIMSPLGLPSAGTTFPIQADGDDLSTFLASNGFDLSGLLNTSAQWPDPGTIDFDSLDQDNNTVDSASGLQYTIA